jgi:hypothetical protein
MVQKWTIKAKLANSQAVYLWGNHNRWVPDMGKRNIDAVKKFDSIDDANYEAKLFDLEKMAMNQFKVGASIIVIDPC